MSSVQLARLALSSARSLYERDPALSLVAFERATAMAATAGQRELEAEAELGWGQALCALDGRERESLPHLQRAAMLGSGRVTEALAWLTAADVFRYTKDVERTLAGYSKAAELFAALSDTRGEYLARESLALLLQSLDRGGEALPHLARAGNLALRDNDLAKATETYHKQGELLVRLSRPSEAIPLLKTAAEMCRQMKDSRMEARVLVGLLAAEQAIGIEPAATPTLLRLAELIAAHAAREGGTAAAVDDVPARVLDALHDEREASSNEELRALAEAVESYHRRKDLASEAETRFKWGFRLAELERTEASLEQFAGAAALYSELKDVLREGQAHLGCAVALRLAGRHNGSLSELDRASRLFTACGNTLMWVQAEDCRLDMLAELHRWDEALEHCAQLASVTEKESAPEFREYELKAHYHWARGLGLTKNPKAALPHARRAADLALQVGNDEVEAQMREIIAATLRMNGEE